MSEPRHRFESVAADAPAQYVPTPSTHTPSGEGPDQWAEAETPESASLEISEPESDDLALAHS